MKINKITIMIGLIIIGLFVVSCTNVGTSNDENSVVEESFVSGEERVAKCLTENGATMFGTEWCPHCKDQKSNFGEAFEYVDYVDCDENQIACSNAGVRGYPTWRINGQLYPGARLVSDLAGIAGC
jgi:glutaredoxin